MKSCRFLTLLTVLVAAFLTLSANGKVVQCGEKCRVENEQKNYVCACGHDFESDCHARCAGFRDGEFIQGSCYSNYCQNPYPCSNKAQCFTSYQTTIDSSGSYVACSGQLYGCMASSLLATCPYDKDPVCVKATKERFENACRAQAYGFSKASYDNNVDNCEFDSPESSQGPAITDDNKEDICGCSYNYNPVCVKTAWSKYTFYNQCFKDCAQKNEKSRTRYYLEGATTVPGACDDPCSDHQCGDNAVCFGYKDSYRCIPKSNDNPSAECMKCQQKLDADVSLRNKPVCVEVVRGDKIVRTEWLNECAPICTLGYKESDIEKNPCENDLSCAEKCKDAGFNPVCVNQDGQDINIDNQCLASCRKLDIISESKCPERGACNCLMTPDPVCAETTFGKTAYLNYCLAKCDLGESNFKYVVGACYPAKSPDSTVPVCTTYKDCQALDCPVPGGDCPVGMCYKGECLPPVSTKDHWKYSPALVALAGNDEDKTACLANSTCLAFPSHCCYKWDQQCTADADSTSIQQLCSLDTNFKCEDDPEWHKPGYPEWTCKTYHPEGYNGISSNNFYCVSDGAWDKTTATGPCCASCTGISSVTTGPSTCRSSRNKVSDMGDCASYGPYGKNKGYCEDVALVSRFGEGKKVKDVCKKECDPQCASNQSCQDDMLFDHPDGYGDCKSYAPGGANWDPNFNYCENDGVSKYCPLSCGLCKAVPLGGMKAKDLATLCTNDQTWDGGYGGCDNYGLGGTNEDYCEMDGACDDAQCPCKWSCLNSCRVAWYEYDKCYNDPSWTGKGYGGCATYAPGEINHDFCVDDGACTPTHCPCAWCKAECVGTEMPGVKYLGSITSEKCASCISNYDTWCKYGVTWDDSCEKISKNKICSPACYKTIPPECLSCVQNLDSWCEGPGSQWDDECEKKTKVNCFNACSELN